MSLSEELRVDVVYKMPENDTRSMTEVMSVMAKSVAQLLRQYLYFVAQLLRQYLYLKA
jgi:hypothetical protein